MRKREPNQTDNAPSRDNVAADQAVEKDASPRPLSAREDSIRAPARIPREPAFNPQSGSDQDASHPPRASEGASEQEGPTTSRTDPESTEESPNASRAESKAMKHP